MEDVAVSSFWAYPKVDAFLVLGRFHFWACTWCQRVVECIFREKVVDNEDDVNYANLKRRVLKWELCNDTEVG